MSLDYAILGFLNYQPLSGYDLKKIFDRSVRHFWHADQSQIYRTLSRLTAEELVRVEVVEQSDRPDRKVYSINPSGREKLLHWLAAPFLQGESHSSPLVQMFFSGQISDDVMIQKLKASLHTMRMQMAQFDMVPEKVQEFAPMAESQRELFYWFLTLEFGKRSLQMNMDWIESVIQRIQNQDYKTDIGFEQELRLK
jgi:PadR family transcriptional regulator, regulatory protein AphA